MPTRSYILCNPTCPSLSWHHWATSSSFFDYPAMALSLKSITPILIKPLHSSRCVRIPPTQSLRVISLAKWTFFWNVEDWMMDSNMNIVFRCFAKVVTPVLPSSWRWHTCTWSTTLAAPWKLNSCSLEVKWTLNCAVVGSPIRWAMIFGVPEWQDCNSTLNMLSLTLHLFDPRLLWICSWLNVSDFTYLCCHDSCWLLTLS